MTSKTVSFFQGLGASAAFAGALLLAGPSQARIVPVTGFSQASRPADTSASFIHQWPHVSAADADPSFIHQWPQASVADADPSFIHQWPQASVSDADPAFIHQWPHASVA